MLSVPSSEPWAAVQPSWSQYHPRDEKLSRAQSRSWLASFAPSVHTLPLSEKHPWESSDPSLIRCVSRWARHRLPSFELPVLPPLPSPSAVRFVLLCALWYTTSALSSNTGKIILTQFRYPITLTFIQFGFVAAYCLLFMSPLVHFSTFRPPSRAIFQSTIPMGFFQVGGHIFSSMAISRIPVSTVHTIKALSPLFTVAAYALLFRVRYSPKTYLSLLPLTLGVMLACSFDMTAGNAMGLLCAFGSSLVFVTSNIFFKKIMPSNGGSTAHKLDKLNLLFYSSSMAFLLMVPIWAYYDLPLLLAAAADPAHVSHPPHDGGAHSAHFHTLAQHVLANGTVHFAQNIIAFVLLAQTSPVTYSIASLVKRVAVILTALVWFAQPVHPVQGLGIALTFAGLCLYNRAKGDVAQGETRMRRVNAARDMALPTTLRDPILDPDMRLPPTVVVDAPPPAEPALAFASAYTRPGAHAHIHPTAAAAAHPFPPSALPAPVPATPPPSYSQTHPHPNLHVKIAQPSGTPPVGSYPSPPPSLDSPPPQHPAWPAARRGSMVTGHPPPHAMLEASAPRAAIVA
ncbi:Putative transporter [Sparassis crispa]|uniref:Transporter n=1 Tax=Sparassis crispa TaxID=139825 RepID=A0A401GWM4_9APHY|nr:Putative transporter [Sparassis crispa]GBE86627.1 Putative transporter [Sparassis crispa]